MKKIISIILTFAFIASLALFSTGSGAVTHGYLKYDANDDGRVDMKDVLAVRKFMVSVYTKKDINFLAADGNKDTMVNGRDLLMIRKVILNIEPSEGNNTDGKYKVDQLKIGGRNISRFTIVLPDSAPEGALLPPMEYAAEELQSYVKNACGITLNTAYESAEVKTNKITYKFDTEDGYDLGKEGFVIEVAEGGDLTFTCGTMRGALYATYQFLEDAVGYRFLTEGVTYLYKAGTLDLPEGYFDRQVPSAVYRAIGANNSGANSLKFKENASECGGYQASKDSTLRLGGAVGTTYLHAHSFAYFAVGFEDRNSADSLGGMIQQCMTDDEFYEQAVDFLLQLYNWRVNDLGQIPGVNFTQLTCSPNDNGGYCTCSNCKAIYAQEKSIAGTQIRFCNRICDDVLPECPGIEIYTCVYAGSHIPPKMSRPDPRLCICFCSVGCNNHSLRNTEECAAAGGNPRLLTGDDENILYNNLCTIPQNNGLWMGFLKGWLELTDNVWYWYYTDNWGFYMSPAANLYNFFDDIKYLNELGVKGYYLEGDAAVVNYSIEKLRIYLEERIMWDPEMTEEEYIDYMNEFLMIYYGEGWRNIKEYIDMYDEAGNLKGCWTNNFDHPWDVLSKEYFADNYAHMEELIDAAYEAATDPVQKSRIELFSVHMHFLGLSATFSCRDKIGGDAKYLENYNWLWNYFNNHPQTYTLDYNLGIGIKENVGAMNDFPSSPSDVRDTMSWLRSDLTGQR